jgi:undecaprenyl-diphosphatase
LPADIAILKFINVTMASPILDRFFVYICDFKIWAWPLAVAIAGILWKGEARARWMILLTVIAVAIIDPAVYRVIKPLAGRLRPCHEVALGWIRAVDGCGGRFSFPSSHAANFFGVAVVVGGFYKMTRYYLYPLAALVAVGRVYLGVHYPSDVLAGAVFGAGIGLLVLYCGKRFFPDHIGKSIYRKADRSDEKVD